ncbi:MAG TPA: hypothetical protein DEA28_01385 [Firmicutes bacterium]|nr:hypothetical protein [Bacillota bacterium]
MEKEDKKVETETKQSNDKEQSLSLEKKKSTFRLFWLFLVIDIILIAGIIYLVIDIFVKNFSN